MKIISNKFAGFERQLSEKSLRQALRRTSLFPTLAMWVFLAILIVMAASLIMREIVALQEGTVHALADRVDQYLLERGRALESVAYTVTISPPERQSQILGKALRVYPSISSLYLLDSAGQVVVVVGSEFELAGIDLSGESFFQNLPVSERASFSAPFVSLTTRRVTTTIAAPVYQDGKLLSILVGELDLSQLQEAIHEGSEGDDQTVTFIVDQEGVLIAHPEETWVQEQRNLGDIRLVQRGLEGENANEVFYDRNARKWYVGSVAAMQSGWVIVTMKPVALAAQSFFLLLAGAVLAISIAVYLVLRVEMRSFSQLAHPILYLAEQADAISGGEKTVIDPAQIGEYSEIINLGRSFAHMVEAMEDRTRSLKMSWQDYRTIIDTIPEMIWYLDEFGRILRANRAALEIMGLDPDEARGKTVYDLYPRELAEAIHSDTRIVVHTGRPILGVVELYTNHAGELRWSETDKLPYLDANGKAIGAIIILRDITERKLGEEELSRYRIHLEDLVKERTNELKQRVGEVEELNQTLGVLLADLQAAQERTEKAAQMIEEANHELEAFAYTVSHDLRAPLRHINAYSRLLAEAEGNRIEPSSAELLQSILQSVDRMDQLINDLLAFSRTGRAEMKSQPVDMGRIIEQARRELNPQADGRAIRWEVGDLPVVEGDPSLLRQVWINLLSNAIKFSTPRAEAVIQIGCQPTDESRMTAFFVKDNGVGFDPVQAEKLFGVFQRLHRMDEFEGTGIGLATVKRIVQRHGGRVWADASPGEGATFFITLPTQ